MATIRTLRLFFSLLGSKFFNDFRLGPVQAWQAAWAIHKVRKEMDA